MKLLDKYILKQIFAATLVGIILFIVVWISPEILFKIIKRTVAGEYTIAVAIKRFIFEIPEILGKAIPVGLLLGNLFIFDKLSKDFELTILRNIGISLKRILAPVIALSLIFSVLCFVTYDKLIPVAAKKLAALNNDRETIQFVYMKKTKEEKPEQIIIVSNYRDYKIKGVTVLNFSQHNLSNKPLMDRVYSAEYALYTPDYWELKDGVEYFINDVNIYEDITKFDSIKILDKETSARVYKIMQLSTKKHETFTNDELKEYISLLKKEKLTDEYLYNQNKLYQRYFQVISCIFLAICGVVLGFGRPREKRLIGFTSAVGVIFMYYLINPFLDLLAQYGVLPPMLTAAIPCLLVIAATLTAAKLKQLI